MSPGGRHGHKVRELKRRIDAVLEEERERHTPPPPPISSEHAAIRERIERREAEIEGRIGRFVRAVAALDPRLPEDASFQEAHRALMDLRDHPGHPELVEGYIEIACDDFIDLWKLHEEERDLLVSLGVDPRPWRW
jgi:hypothetical protein